MSVLSPLDHNTVSGAEPHWCADFWVADVDEAAAQATLHGGRVLLPPTDVPAFRTAVLADAAGATFSASQLTLFD